MALEIWKVLPLFSFSINFINTIITCISVANNNYIQTNKPLLQNTNPDSVWLPVSLLFKSIETIKYRHSNTPTHIFTMPNACMSLHISVSNISSGLLCSYILKFIYFLDVHTNKLWIKALVMFVRMFVNIYLYSIWF